MRRYPEAEAILPRLSPINFPREQSARERDISFAVHWDMAELRSDWKVVGWALAAEVTSREDCDYVVLFDNNGERLWCHLAGISFSVVASRVADDPSKVVPR